MRVPLLAGSAIAWVALLVQAWMPASSTNGMAGSSMDDMSGGISPGAIVAGGALMVVAMMVPLLGPPTRHVLASSFARRRARTVAEFLVGYLALWTLVGAAMMALPEVLGASLGLTVAALLAAAIWQCSPAKQRCLDRLHAHPTLPAFAPKADLAAVRFGLTHACWCIGACWALMAVAVVVPGWSLLAMALVTLWLAGERLERPERPAWRLRVPTKAMRLVRAQTEIALRGPAPSRRGAEEGPYPASTLARPRRT